MDKYHGLFLVEKDGGTPSQESSSCDRNLKARLTYFYTEMEKFARERFTEDFTVYKVISFSKLSELGYSLILAGGFNASSRHWGDGFTSIDSGYFNPGVYFLLHEPTGSILCTDHGIPLNNMLKNEWMRDDLPRITEAFRQFLENRERISPQGWYKKGLS